MNCRHMLTGRAAANFHCAATVSGRVDVASRFSLFLSFVKPSPGKNRSPDRCGLLLVTSKHPKVKGRVLVTESLLFKLSPVQ